MGTSQIASAPSTGGKIFYKMLHFVLLLSASSLAKASYGPALGLGPEIGPRYGYSSGYQQQHTCHTVYDSATDTACHTEHDQICHTEQDQVCHTEFDTVVDTTYVEDCQDIVTEQCHQVSQQVHHSSGVVGHDSQVLPGSYGGHPVGKREAEPSYGAIGGHSTGPQCLAKCVSLWRSGCPARCATMLRSSTTTMEPELSVEPQLLEVLVLLLALELEQDMDMLARHKSHTF